MLINNKIATTELVKALSDDLRNGVDRHYSSAGMAVRTQISNLTSAISNEETRAKIEEARIESLFTQPVEDAVGDWLNEHPEATTTVQDNSLIISKFTDSTKSQVLNNFVTPEMFGAKGDGITDDSSAFQLAVDSGEIVCGSSGMTYYIHDVILYNAEVRNCRFTGKDKTKTCFYLRSFSTVTGCRFSDFDIAISKQDGAVIVHSQISDNVISYSNNGIVFTTKTNGEYDNSSLNSIVIARNYINKCGTNADDYSGEITDGVGYGVYLDGNIDGVYITNNVFEYHTNCGIYLNNTSTNFQVGVIIEHNYFEGNRACAVYVNVLRNANFITIQNNYFSNVSTNIRNSKYVMWAGGTSVYTLNDIRPIGIISLYSRQTEHIDNINHKAILTGDMSPYCRIESAEYVSSDNKLRKIIYNAKYNSTHDIRLRKSDATTDLFKFEEGLHIEFFEGQELYYIFHIDQLGENDTIEILYLGRA